MAEQERLDRQKAVILARQQAAVAAFAAAEAAPAAPQPAPVQVDDEPGRQLWDTGPIRLARTAARTLRTSRRPSDRVPTAV